VLRTVPQERGRSRARSGSFLLSLKDSSPGPPTSSYSLARPVPEPRASPRNPWGLSEPGMVWKKTFPTFVNRSVHQNLKVHSGHGSKYSQSQRWCLAAAADWAQNRHGIRTVQIDSCPHRWSKCQDTLKALLGSFGQCRHDYLLHFGAIVGIFSRSQLWRHHGLFGRYLDKRVP